MGKDVFDILDESGLSMGSVHRNKIVCLKNSKHETVELKTSF